MKFTYPAIFKKEQNGRITVSFPDFPECLTDGKDKEEALFEAKDALQEVIVGRINRGEHLPREMVNIAGEESLIAVTVKV